MESNKYKFIVNGLDDRLTVGEFIEWQMKEQNLSSIKLSDKTGIAGWTIRKIKSNMSEPRIGTIQKLLRALGYELQIVPLKGKQYE